MSTQQPPHSGYWLASDGNWYPPAPPSPVAPAPKKRLKVRWAVLAVVGVFSVALLGAAGARGAVTSSTHTVVYLVTCKPCGSSPTADVTYTKADGATGQQSGIDVPMMNAASGQPGMTETMSSGHPFYISAQLGTDTGGITCSVTVDGVQVSSETSYGGYTIATCSGSVS